MLLRMISFASVFAANMLSAQAQETPPPLTPEAINGARLESIGPLSAPTPAPAPEADETEVAADPSEPAALARPEPAMIRLQVLLDRFGASPGVIDGFDGDNVRKAVRAAETMLGLPVDGEIDADLASRLESGDPVVGRYTITPEDAADIVGPLPEDYSALARLDYLGYASLREKLAERFHMDEDLLQTLNPGAGFVEGEAIIVAAYGPDLAGKVVHLAADKAARQLRAYDAQGRMVVAYPATIGSQDNPSPSGTHRVEAVAPMPNYTYDPENFVQGGNTSTLVLPPGPNGPVGSMWIDLSEPTYGIHGTPEPALIDKTSSHGCVRLTNWDAGELSTMVEPGVTVAFLN